MKFSWMSKLSFFPRFNLGPKAVICAAFLIAINTAMLVGAGYLTLRQ